MEESYENKELKDVVKISADVQKSPTVYWFEISQNDHANMLEPLDQFKESRLLAIFIEDNLQESISLKKSVKVSATYSSDFEYIYRKIYKPSFDKMQEIYENLKEEKFTFNETRKFIDLLGSAEKLDTEIKEIAKGFP